MGCQWEIAGNRGSPFRCQGTVTCKAEARSGSSWVHPTNRGTVSMQFHRGIGKRTTLNRRWTNSLITGEDRRFLRRERRKRIRARDAAVRGGQNRRPPSFLPHCIVQRDRVFEHFWNSGASCRACPEAINEADAAIIPTRLMKRIVEARH